MSETGIPADERALLEAEQTAFAGKVLADAITQAADDREARGAQYDEPIYIEGTVDGTTYSAYVSPKTKLES